MTAKQLGAFNPGRFNPRQMDLITRHLEANPDKKAALLALIEANPPTRDRWQGYVT
jgi:hypothetical protein